MLTLGVSACGQKPRPGRYALVVPAYLLGLLAKPMLVTLPFVLLLASGRSERRPPGAPADGRTGMVRRGDAPVRPCRRFERRNVHRAADGGGLVGQDGGRRIWTRLGNAAVSSAATCSRTWADGPGSSIIRTWSGLGDRRDGDPAAGRRVGGRSAAVRQPYLFTGWFWYLGTLVPVIGAVQVGSQAMADRYTLFPALGLSVAVVWLSADLAGARPFPKAVAAISGAGLTLLLVAATRAQVGIWRDGATLFTHTLSVTRDNWHIEHEYGVLLLNARRYDEAEAHLREALRLQPNHVLAHYNLAGILFRRRQPDRAAEEYRQVVRLRPDFAEAHFRLARALAVAGRWEEALPEYAAALRLDPGHAGAIGRRAAGTGGPWALTNEKDEPGSLGRAVPLLMNRGYG